MESLSLWFEKLIFGGTGTDSANAGPRVITFVGSGGKTSLIWLLARRLAQNQNKRKILVTPTTKMFLPGPGEQLFDRYCDGAPPSPIAGVTLAGIFNKKTGKLESLPLPALEKIIRAYDLVLIEGDGSRALPLKGWADHEPVVPRFTDITVAMLPLRPLGMPATEKIIHRLPQFCTLSGASPGEAVSPCHLAAVISGSKKEGESSAARSLFTAAQGKKILFINQIEDEAAFTRACDLVSLLPSGFCSGLYTILAGSVKRDTVQEIKNSSTPQGAPFTLP